MVTAYAMAEELNISQLRKALEAQGLYVIHELPVGDYTFSDSDC